MPYINYTSKEVASRGEAIYRQEIRHKVDPKHKGKFLVIDIETGKYEMNADDLVATKRLLAKRPDAACLRLTDRVSNRSSNRRTLCSAHTIDN